MNRSLVLATLAAAAASTLGVRAAAAVPEQLSLTARVTDGATPLTGSHTVTVRLHTTAAGGTPTWTETQNTVATDGLVYLTLGNQMAITDAIADGGPLFAEVQIDSTVLQPRLAITSAVYAIRAGVAEDADRLGGQPSTAFAAANHDHTGTYLPLGTTLACTGTEKVVSINPSTGSIVCGADQGGTSYTNGAGLGLVGSQFSVLFGGTGTQSLAARADHAHPGIYLPVGATLACPAGQFQTALQPNGSVTCATPPAVAFAGTGVASTAARSDHNHAGVYLPLGALLACPIGQVATGLQTNGSVSCIAASGGDITGVTAGPGLTGGGGGGDVTLSVAFAGTGASSSAARADHTHAVVCPLGYLTHTVSSGSGPALCTKRVVQAGDWSQAATACYLQHNGGELCTYGQMRIAVTAAPGETLSNGYWMGDRIDDNWVLRVNGTTTNDFDEKIEIVSTTVLGPGYYCCQRAQ